MTTESRPLDRALVQGIAWTGGLKWLTQLGTWVVGLLVARLITPSWYGLFAMAIVYTGFVQFVSEFGLSIALVQRRDLTAIQLAQLGGVATLAGVGACLVSMLISPLIAALFGEPTLSLVIRGLSLTFAIRGLQVLPRATLARDLAFRRLAWISTIEATAWSATSLVGAVFGFGVWALVGAALMSALVATGVLFWWCPLRPAWPRNARALVATTHLGWFVLVAQLCWYIYDHVDLTLVGLTFGKNILGAYAKASDIADVPVDRISSLVNQVTPAVFASAETDVGVLRRHLLGLTEGLALVTFPMAIGMALVADLFVMAVLGDAWRPAIVPLRLLGLLGGFRAVSNLFPQTLIAAGRAKLNAQLNVVTTIVVTGALILGTHWGVAGVAVNWLISVPLITTLTFFRQTFRILRISVREYLHALWPATSAGLGITVAVLALRMSLPHALPATAALGWCVFVGAVAYIGVLVMAHRPRLRCAVALLPMLRARPTSIPAEELAQGIVLNITTAADDAGA